MNMGSSVEQKVQWVGTDREFSTLQALDMWLLATMVHWIPCSTNTGMALSVNTISAGKNPIDGIVVVVMQKNNYY